MWHKQYLLSQPIFPNSCSKQCQIMKYLPVHANALRTPRWQHTVKERKNDNWFIQVMSWYLATVGTYTESSGNSWWRSPHAATKIICQYVILSAVYMQSFLNDQFPLPLSELLWHSYVYKLKTTKLIILILLHDTNCKTTFKWPWRHFSAQNKRMTGLLFYISTIVSICTWLCYNVIW